MTLRTVLLAAWLTICISLYAQLPVGKDLVALCSAGGCGILAEQLANSTEAEIQAWLNTRDERGLFPLLTVAWYNNTDVLQFLLDKGANPSQVDNRGYAPLHYAAHKGYLEMAHVLLNAGVSPIQTNKEGFAPLHFAAQRGRLELTQILLSSGADANQASNACVTSLYIAAQNGHTDVVRILLDAGADPNQAKDCGSTPLHVTAQKGHSDVVQILLDAGADPGWTDNYGDAPLHVAALQRWPVVATQLLQAGADPQLRNNRGHTALEVARTAANNLTEKDRTAMAVLQDCTVDSLFGWLLSRLWRYGTLGEIAELHGNVRQGGSGFRAFSTARLNTPRLDGCTPLHLACLHGNRDAAAELVFRGVELSPLNLQKETPLQLASGTGNHAVADIVRSAVASSENSSSSGREQDLRLLSKLPVLPLREQAATVMRRHLSTVESRVLSEQKWLSYRMARQLFGAGLY